MAPLLPAPPHDTRRRDALSIDSLIDTGPVPSRSAPRQCGKCQEVHSKCDGREPCRNCEDRGTLCGYAWSALGTPHTVSHTKSSSIFPQTNGGWALVPVGANAPAASSSRSDMAVKSCKTCQARNTPCDGVTPVCGSCRLRRLECYLASPSTDKKGNNSMAWSARDKQALNPRSFPPSLMTLAAPRMDSAKTGHKALDKPFSGKEVSSSHKGLEGSSHRHGSHASSSRPEASSSRSSLSFMLNPTGGDKSRDKRKLDRPENVHVTPPTPIAATSMEHAQAQAMDVDEPRLGSPIHTRASSPGPLLQSPGPLSPGSSTGASLSRRPSRKRSASPEREWSSPEQGRGWASPGRDSVSSMGMSGMRIEGRERSSGSFSRERRSMDSHEGRRSIDSYHTRQSLDSHSIDSSRLSIDSLRPDLHSRPIDTHPNPHPQSHSRTHSTEVSPTDSRPRSRSKSSLSHLLDGGGYGGMGGTSPTDAASESLSRPLSAESSNTPSAEGHSKPTSSDGYSKRASSESFSRPLSAGPSRPPNESFPRPIGPETFPRPTSTEIFSRPEPFSRPMSAEYPRPVDSFPKPMSPEHSRPSTATPVPKRDSISTSLADMQLKSAGTSRASSPGVFVHSAFTPAASFNAPSTSTARWTTFGAAGESMGRIESNVWRHETEAGMRRREDARQAGQGADLHRRKSEGGVKRRRVGERSISSEARRSSEEKLPAVEERRMSIVESERRMSVVEERKMSVDRSISIVEHVRRATEAQHSPEPPTKSQSLPNRRASGSTSGVWADETRRDPERAIVVSDSPEAETADTEMAAAERSEPLITGTLSTPVPPSEDRTPVPDDSAAATSPLSHIWHPPANETSKKPGRRKYDSEPVPSRSFITKLNLPPVPSVSQPTKAASPEEEKDKETGSSQPSVLRSMLTTMPPRVVFLAAVQSFLTQPTTKARRNRAVIMTKSLMKDALAVLLDPRTDELLKDYVPEKKDEEKNGKERDGTPARGRKMSIAVDVADHSSLEFKAWARRMFSTVKTSRGEDTLAFGGKPVVVEDDIYETIVICHAQGNHCSAEETSRLVDQSHSWVPRALIEAFVQECPGCPPSNKVLNPAKPKKRKWVRGAAQRKSATSRRGKKAQDAEQPRKPRKNSGKEASPEESDGDLENEQEEDELKESGDEAAVKAESQEPEPDLDQDDVEAEGGEEGDEAEELEMESEDEHVSAAPASRPAVIASLVPDLEKSKS